MGTLDTGGRCSSTDRRTGKDRRSGGSSNYNGPERRSEKFREVELTGEMNEDTSFIPFDSVELNIFGRSLVYLIPQKV